MEKRGDGRVFGSCGWVKWGKVRIFFFIFVGVVRESVEFLYK